MAAAAAAAVVLAVDAVGMPVAEVAAAAAVTVRAGAV